MTVFLQTCETCFKVTPVKSVVVVNVLGKKVEGVRVRSNLRAPLSSLCDVITAMV